MDSFLSTESSFSLSSVSGNYSGSTKYNTDALVIEKTLSNQDTVNLNYSDRFKTLSISAQEIVKKLNEMLKGTLPAGIESLNPDDYTSEATSTRIVQSVTAFFGAFREQNPELSEEEALDKFMETVKSGVQKGYDDAFGTLQGLGAFEIDGIQKGVEQTKILIDQKLDAFYNAKRKELGLETKETPTEEKVSTEIAKQAGTQAVNISA